MKKSVLMTLGALMALVVAVTPVWADCDKHGKDCDGKQCSLKDKSCDKKDCDKPCCDESSQCPIASKLMKKAKFFLKNQKEIGLSEDQVAQITALKMATKKSSIKMKADMEIFELDLMERMSAPKLDVEGANAMLDQAAAGWGAGAKATLADYAKLKAVLTDAQMAKAKEIWMKDEK